MSRRTFYALFALAVTIGWAVLQVLNWLNNVTEAVFLR